MRKSFPSHRMVFLACLLSAALLTVSFPRIELSFFIWIAIVPLLWVLEGQKPWAAFRRAWVCGFLFFAATVGWVCYVTYIGAFFLAAFLALYFALFGIAFVYFSPLSPVPRIFVLSSVWVVLEYIRGHFLSGFGWVMLGYAQYKNLWLIQMADITGAYGVSFLVVLVNLVIFEIWKSRNKRDCFVAALLAMTLVGLAMAYGACVMGHEHIDKTVKVGVVQPNISLEQSWDEAQRPWIIDQTIQLTQQFHDKDLDLIVWPETALPGDMSDSPFLVHAIRDTAAAMHAPIIMGSVSHEGSSYYNSAFLIGSDGQIRGHYDKIHLVPFGEYIPLRPVLGWIGKMVGLDDFAFGRTYTVFPISGGKKFSALICFEDTLGDLERRFVMAGAQFFVNVTNDAWFKDTKASFLHLQTAVFGCVENHRALARAANTGVSALIDPWGRIISVAQIRGKKTFVQAVDSGELPLLEDKSFYTKYGDFFTCLCFLCILGAVALRKPA